MLHGTSKREKNDAYLETTLTVHAFPLPPWENQPIHHLTLCVVALDGCAPFSAQVEGTREDCSRVR
jgi:hypothetical protein